MNRLFTLDEERWGGKNPPEKAVVKSRRAASSLLNTTSEASKIIFSLKNGYLSFGKISIQTIHTCPFDSVYTVVSAMYADFEKIKLKIDEIRLMYDDGVQAEFLRMVERMSEDFKSNAIKLNVLLRDRNYILNEIFDGDERVDEFNGLRSIDCSSNVHYLIQKVLPTELFSYKRIKQCDRCENTIVSNRCFIDINYDDYEIGTIKKLNDCLLTQVISERHQQCVCGGPRNATETKFSDFVMIDLQLEYCIKPISLNKIPKNLNILGIEFNLYACIEFIGDDNAFLEEGEGKKENPIGHYVAHIFRRNMWERFDDLKSFVSKSDTKAKIKGQVLFYVRN